MTRRHRERCTARSAIIHGGHAAAHCLPEDLQAPKNRPRTLPSTHPLKPKNLSGVESIRKTNASKIDMRFPWRTPPYGFCVPQQNAIVHAVPEFIRGMSAHLWSYHFEELLQ